MPLRLYLTLLLGGHTALLSSPDLPHGARAGQQADSSAAWAFVDLLASAWTPVALKGPYDPKRADHWDDQRLLALVSQRGLTFYSATTDSSWHTSYGGLARGLKSRRGRSFSTLLHLGYIRAQPYAQYSALTVTSRGDTVSVRVAGWYDVTLLPEAGTLKAVKVSYLQTELE